MSVTEFELIEAYFSNSDIRHKETRTGIGDDCALLSPDEKSDLAFTTDTLVEGIHFLPDSDPEALGHKALAVSLSDLAAIGAEPKWALLALSLPAAKRVWLQKFAKGFFALARMHSVELVGGDTTKGPLVINVQAIGLVSKSAALLRSNARVGDKIYVTGTLGDAGLALAVAGPGGMIANSNIAVRLQRPTPRVDIGLSLRGLAHACIDISDGLVADLGHILRASGVGATIHCQSLPLSDELVCYVEETGDYKIPLSAGDDYELCFTMAPENLDVFARKAKNMSCAFTCIGEIESASGLRVTGTKNGELLKGYEHFS